MTIEPTWVYGPNEYERAKRAGKIQNGYYAGCRVYINLGPRKDDWKSIEQSIQWTLTESGRSRLSRQMRIGQNGPRHRSGGRTQAARGARSVAPDLGSLGRSRAGARSARSRME